MHWQNLIRSMAAAQFVTVAVSYGTTVFSAFEYCQTSAELPISSALSPTSVSIKILAQMLTSS